LGGFPTPDGIRKPSPFRSKRERSSFSKPDIDSAGTVGGEGYFVGQVYHQFLPFPMKRPFTN
jgi:hypothetical protein